MLFPDYLDPNDPAYPFWAERLAVYRRSHELWLATGNPWSPIETAPMELGVLVCGEGRAMDVAQNFGEEGWYSSPNDRFYDPKWWCPLPPHPLLIHGSVSPPVQRDKLAKQRARSEFLATVRARSQRG
jgi:hypothetical protein